MRSVMSRNIQSVLKSEFDQASIDLYGYLPPADGGRPVSCYSAALTQQTIKAESAVKSGWMKHVSKQLWWLGASGAGPGLSGPWAHYDQTLKESVEAVGLRYQES